MARKREWWRITAPHYCAGLVAVNEFVVEAAPIIRWTVTKHLPWVLAYFARKGYRVEKLEGEYADDN